MRKHFWHVQWFLNGQKWGVKKASLYDHFEGLTTDSYLAKQDPLGGDWIEKKGFFNPLLMRKHDFWHVQWFLNGQKWGVKKSISVCPFWRFDSWLLFGKTRPPGGRPDRKEGLFNPLLMRKHDFWHVQWFLNGQKWGVKKNISVCPFQRFNNWLLFGKTRPPGGRSDRKEGFFNPLLMRKHDFWHVQWFLNGQKWGVKKSISVCPFWRFDNWLLFGKTRPLGGGQIEKRLFQPSSDEKTWFLTCPVVFKWSKMGVKKASLYDHFEGLTTDSYLAKQDPLGGDWIEKKAFSTLFWWENMISDMSSGF